MKQGRGFHIGVGQRLYISVIAAFLAFALTFVVYQQHREKEYRISILDDRLQDFNLILSESLGDSARLSEQAVNNYLAANGMPNMRVTLIRPDGTVFFDTWSKDYAAIGNHASRAEVRDAINHGSGRAIERQSATVHQNFFYSATYFPAKHYIVRSALPYDDTLISILDTDKNYLWLSLGALLLLTLVLYRFIHHLGTNITKLRLFASRADNNETLDIQDLAEFPDDELGEIAERIIKVYKRYQRTRQEQDELKRQLTHNIAHELKTPVASIQGYLETIIDHPNLDPDTLAMFLNRSYAQCQRLTSLIRDISTLNVMDEVSDIHGREQVDISRMVSEIGQDTAIQFQQHSMTFDDRLPAGIVVTGVRSLLYSIFRNLTDNALAYAGDGTAVVVEAKDCGDSWHFTFYDTGRGVPAEHLPRIFERFYRVDKGRSRALGGTGLGLAIVKNAVLIHHGTIRAANRPEGGLRFDFSLSKA